MPASHPPLPEPKEPPGTFLFSDEIIQNLTNEEEKYGIYTAERLPKDKREAVIQLLAEQRGIRDIARIVRVHTSSISRVADNFAVEIADIRGRLARKLRRVVWAQADRLEQFPDMLPASSIPLAIKMLGEHAELLDGKATSRTEVVERIDIFSDYQAFLESLEMETKNRAPGIGDAGEKSALIAGRLEDRDRAADLGPIIDFESSVSDPIYEGEPPNVPGFIPGAPSKAIDTAGSQATPPGGGPAAPGPGQPAMDNCTQNFWPNGSFEEDIDE